MRIAILFTCLALGLALPQGAFAKKEGGKGGGKGARAAGGGGGGGRGGGGARAAFSGMAANKAAGNRPSGGGQHARSNFQGGSKGGQNLTGTQLGSKGQHGLNSRNRFGSQNSLNSQGGGKSGHGLNAQQNNVNSQSGSGHRLNSTGNAGLQGQHLGRNGNAGFQGQHVGAKGFGNHAGTGRFAGQGRVAGLGRNGVRYHNWHDACAGYHRVVHDRVWWTSHYETVVAINGGYWGPWYWNAGYWFPAWGYYPGFTFVYERPIYGWNNLPPDQVVVVVQERLQDQGYYSGNVDGQMGDLTRDALAKYQQDHQLEVTSAIDEPTVQSLGLLTEES